MEVEAEVFVVVVQEHVFVGAHQPHNRAGGRERDKQEMKAMQEKQEKKEKEKKEKKRKIKKKPASQSAELPTCGVKHTLCCTTWAGAPRPRVPSQGLTVYEGEWGETGKRGDE